MIMDLSKPRNPKEKEGVKKIHRKVFFILILMVICVLIVLLVYALIEPDSVVIIAPIIVIPLIIITFGILNLTIILEKCPRCGTLLALSTLFSLTYKCRNCGLRII
jgi:uncharacterized membrane protein